MGCEVISVHSYDVEFRHTADHSNVDGLSRLPLNCVTAVEYNPKPSLCNINQLESLPVTAVQIAAATRSDKIYQYTVKGWPSKVEPSLIPYFSKRDELTVERGCILCGLRVLIPIKWRDRLVELHRDHLGICRKSHVVTSGSQD